MIRKRKTAKYLNTLLPPNQSRLSLGNFSKYHPLDHSLERMVKSIIQEFISAAEYRISFKERGEQKYKNMLQLLDGELEKYIDLNLIAQEPHVLIECESQPQQVNEYIKPRESVKQPLGKRRISSKLERWGKEKSQSCDINDELKRSDKFKKELQVTRKCVRNQMVCLEPSCRISENQDHSEEIQELLRRKKQLLLESKQAPRVHTEFSKTLILDKKQKKFFGQNDEGELFEILSKNPVKVSKDAAPILRLQNIKVLAGQQPYFQTSLKKKPIIQLLTTRKTKKRKEIGDTCVFIEQMYEVDNSSKLDQEQLIEQAFKAQKGVKCIVKQKCRTSIVRLPTIR